VLLVLAATPVSSNSGRERSAIGQQALTFSVPMSGAGTQPIDPKWRGPVLAAAEDGTFWLSGDGNRILHCDQHGSILGSVNLPAGLSHLVDLKARGSDIWILGLPLDPDEPNIVYRLTIDGRELAKYAVPEQLRDFGVMIIGKRGDVTLRDKWDGTEFWQLTDTNGALNPKYRGGYPEGGELYVVSHDDESNLKFVEYGRTRVAIPNPGFGFPLDQNVLSVNEDGSFYLRVETGLIGTAIDHYYNTVFYYAPDGKLTYRSDTFETDMFHSETPRIADVPLSSFAFSPRGIFYPQVIEPKNAAASRRVEIRRLTLFKVEEPLPAYPTTDTAKTPVAGYDLTPTAAMSLIVLTKRANAIAHVQLEPRQRTTNFLALDVEVKEWLKKPEFTRSVVTHSLTLWVHFDASGRLPVPEVFGDETVGEYILFLTIHGQNPWDALPAYFLTGDTLGAFSIQNRKIGYAGIPKYSGIDLSQFKDEIRRTALMLVPTATASPVPTATPWPTFIPTYIPPDSHILAPSQTSTVVSVQSLANERR
jgi:hypothetical protein